LPEERPVAVVFTQQSIGLGARKTSMVFIAEGLAAQGYDVHVVTTQLSWLSRLRPGSKLKQLGGQRANRWYDHERLRAMVWVPPLHPVSVRSRLGAALTAPLIDIYGSLLPDVIRTKLRMATLVLVESCAAVALFRDIKRIASRAAVVYSMSDRLDAVGMHPGLHRRLLQDAADYDLVRVPASSLMTDLPGARCALIRHGLMKEPFDKANRNPYARAGNAVLIGDMRLDSATLGTLVESFPTTQFHYFGRKSLGLTPRPNLTVHGEVPFEVLVPFVKYADVGLALYLPAPGLEYLAESSLKLIQYDYCQLPIVGPAFLATQRDDFHAYEELNPTSACDAMRLALSSRRSRRSSAQVLSWEQVVERILASLESPPPRTRVVNH
jgi:2-beta-glucuronyltransferase